MDIATQNHLRTLRDLLTFRRRELLADVRAAGREERLLVDVQHEVADRKDESARRQSVELLATEEQREREELADVEDALHRLDAGVYGDCADCGDPIPGARLMVQPAARRCAACQSLREAGSGAPGPTT
ncbi:MAG: TraR/DksA family transcriptional regulator [Proteobacteria bacterium]|nr:TraR/DksA family transcriptional regulator [Pseudomonadota bacterium]